MTWPVRQAPVLRALRTHRVMDAEQLQQVDFRTVSRRSCQRCLTTLHRRGLVVRTQPTRGGFGDESANDGDRVSDRGAAPGLTVHHPVMLVQSLEVDLAGAPRGRPNRPGRGWGRQSAADRRSAGVGLAVAGTDP